jgi:hypothetical protein
MINRITVARIAEKEREGARETEGESRRKERCTSEYG